MRDLVQNGGAKIGMLFSTLLVLVQNGCAKIGMLFSTLFKSYIKKITFFYLHVIFCMLSFLIVVINLLNRLKNHAKVIFHTQLNQLQHW